jgi:hypothetical protein
MVSISRNIILVCGKELRWPITCDYHAEGNNQGESFRKRFHVGNDSHV